MAWLWSPVIFNPNGVEWLDVIKDFDGWLQWMTAEDDDPDKSWHAWWIKQNAVRFSLYMYIFDLFAAGPQLCAGLSLRR